MFARDSIAGLAGVDPASLTGPQPADVVNRCVAPVASHEAIETLIDKYADDFSMDSQGVEWAKEGCDAVESSSYPVEIDGQQVLVSDYLLPAYFDAATPAGAQVDEMGVLTDGPFTVAADGYAITVTGGEIQQTFGDTLAGWRRAQHEAAHPGSRTAKRFKAVEGRDATPPTPLDPGGTDAEIADAQGRHPSGHPEPTPVDVAVIQDNVTDPAAPTTTFTATGETLTHDPSITEPAFGGHALLPDSQAIVDDTKDDSGA